MASLTAPSTKDRLPPQNLDAEVAVLGSLLLDGQTIPEVAQILSSSDFYSPEHRIIYSTILDLFDQGKPVDLVILTEALTQREALDRVGGRAALIEIIEKVPTAANAQHYANIVHQAAVRRRLIHTCTEVARDSYDTSIPVDALLDKAQAEIFSVTQSDRSHGPAAVKDGLQSMFDDIANMRENRITGVRGCGARAGRGPGCRRCRLVLRRGRRPSW